MLGLVVVLWCVYVSDCFMRQQQGRWTFRGGLKRMHGVPAPDLELLGDRFGFAWTPLLPWHAAYSFGGRDYSVKTVKKRLAALTQHRRWLNVAAGALFVWVMLVFPVLVLSDLIVPLFRIWVIPGAIIWLFALVVFHLTYKRTHLRRPAFEVWFTALLSPLSLMRGPVTIAFSAAADAHPIAAAAVLCDDAEFLHVARLSYFDDPDARPGIEAVVKERGLLARLSAGPESWEAGVTQFCPRCHGTYTSTATACSDCDEIPLRPLTLTSSERAK